MSHRHGISEGRLRALLSAVDADGPNGQGEYVPADFLQAIAGLIGCDEMAYQVMDPGRRAMSCQYDTSPDGHAEDLVADPTIVEMMNLFWRSYWSSPACNYPQVSGDHRTVSRLSDFYFSRAALRTSPVGAFVAEAGIRHELLVPLPADGPRDERILLFRDDGKDFTEQDVLMMSLLRPHIVALRRRHNRPPIPSLTPRQLQILELVAAGCTNTQAARSLGVAPATVRKHLENVFERLEVSSRSAAIVKAMPLLEIKGSPMSAVALLDRGENAHE